jgi:hypothetical protein
MTSEAFPSSGERTRRRPFALPIVWVPLVACAVVAAATSATPVGFLARFFGLVLLAGFGAWCVAVWTSAFDVVMDDGPSA